VLANWPKKDVRCLRTDDAVARYTDKVFCYNHDIQGTGGFLYKPVAGSKKPIHPNDERTHLQNATPLTLGQMISGWVALDQALDGIRLSLPGVYALAIGGTAIGTGLNADARFGEVAARRIAAETVKPFFSAPNKFAALAAHDSMVSVSGTLRTLARALMKIANEVGRYACGPRAGLGELTIPANEPCCSSEPKQKRIKEHLDNSLTLVTALNPHIGYEKAAKISLAAYREDISLREAALKLGFLTADQFELWVRPQDMTYPLRGGL
jgi:fumarate hydratase class II